MSAKRLYTWHKVTKHFKGGSYEFQIRTPQGVRLSKADWELLFEWLGENTDGGHAYGYSLKTRRLQSKSPKLRVVQYPSAICAKLYNFGNRVTTTTRMI